MRTGFVDGSLQRVGTHHAIDAGYVRSGNHRRIREGINLIAMKTAHAVATHRTPLQTVPQR